MNFPLPSLNTPIRADAPLASLTTWRIGGPAKWLAEPTVAEVPKLLEWACGKGVPVYFLGRGSNVLIADEGLPGLVLLTRRSLTKLSREGAVLVAGSGVPLPMLAKFAASEGFSGFEFLIGIPGTVGGGVAMNAGLTVFRPREITSLVKNFNVVGLDGQLSTLTMADICARYRATKLLEGGQFVSEVTFRLDQPGDPEMIKENTYSHLAERKGKQPLDKFTAGSTFKSPSNSRGAGWYIEQAGLKGYQIGGARVSEKHANWIENCGGATAKDVRSLIEHVQEKVVKVFGRKLETEVQFLQ